MTANNSEIEWTFADAEDARSYLRDVAKLWIAWLIALVVLLSFGGYLLVVAAFAVVVAWLILGKPMQRRAAAVMPDEIVEGESWQESAVRRKQRDRLLRELTAGQAPLEAALETAGLSPRLAYARWVMIAVTLLAFWFVIRGLFGS